MTIAATDLSDVTGDDQIVNPSSPARDNAIRLVKFTAPASETYATNGLAITAAFLESVTGLTDVDYVFVANDFLLNGVVTTGIWASDKLVCYVQNTGAEVANGVDIATDVVYLWVVGNND